MGVKVPEKVSGANVLSSPWRVKMLILTRKLGESITIGDDIKIQVLEIKGKQVRLGIQAPKKYSIHREEIYQRIQDENRLAAQQSPLSLKALTDIWKRKK